MPTSSSFRPSVAEILRHLQLISGGELDGLVEIAWTNPRGQLCNARLFQVTKLAEAAEFAAILNRTEGVNIYVGAALRREGVDRSRRAKAADVLGTRVLWFDADTAAQEAVDAAWLSGAEPTAIVQTGTVPELRLHGYWLLPDLLTDKDALAAQLKAIATKLGTDRAVTDPPRVLRLAGCVAWPLKPGRVAELVVYKPASTALAPVLLDTLREAFPIATDEKPARAPFTLRSPALRPQIASPGLLTDLSGALGHIDADDYGDWVAMGHALKTLGEPARELWHAWSATSGLYDPDEAEQKWVGFQPDRTGHQAVFAEAQRRGWRNPPRGIQATEGMRTSEENLALDFARENEAGLRYCAAWGQWLVWDGARWMVDKTLQATDAVRDLCRRASYSATNPREASILGSAKTIAAVERLARSDRRLAAKADQWDTDPWLLNTPGGVVDLRTGEVAPSSPALHMTKLTAAAPGGECPAWLAFLRRITDDDADLQTYLQRVLGYALTGDTSAHALFFAYGTGANGNSVLIDTVAGLLADYHKTAPIETFTESKHERHPTELAMLQGARLVTAVETEEGRRWAESRIKTLTGGDRVSARFMRQDFFEYDPQFKLFIAGNNKPGLRSVDDAMKRRFHMVPFAVTIPADERDLKLKDKLRAEWSGILSWMIAGCIEWQRVGLAPPRTVTAATEAYMEAEDAVSAWIEEHCECDPQAWAPSSELFRSWSSWAVSSGEHMGNMRSFTQTLEARGFRRGRTGQARGIIGLRLNQASTGHLGPWP